MSTIRIVNESTAVQTVGLKRLNGGYELRISFCDEMMSRPARCLLEQLANYIVDSGRIIKPTETVDWASSLLRFDAHTPGMLDVSEANPVTEKFERCADRTLLQWSEQSAVCQSVGSDHVNSLYGGRVTISTGVLEGRPCEGVRYPFAGTGTGWWLFADDYSGDLAEMKTHHLYHVLAVQPKIVKYLALAPGFCFDLTGSEPRIWFEEDVSVQELAPSEGNGRP